MSFLARLRKFRFVFDSIRRTPIYYGKHKREFALLAKAPIDERRAFVEHRLSKILACAAKAKYGRVHEGCDYHTWPLLEKSRVLANESDFRCRPKWECSKAQTSGTTGTPLTLYRSLRSLLIEQIFIDLVQERRGISARHAKTAILMGTVVVPVDQTQPPFWTRIHGGRTLVLSSSHLNTRTLDHFVAELKSFAPDCLFAYPSSLHSLAMLLEARGMRLPIPLAVTSSEVLNPATVALAKRIYGCEFTDYYGQAERVAFAELTEDGRYFFPPGYAKVELSYARDEDDHALYEIIGTNLWNSAMPLVRFRTGDLIAAPKGLSAAELEEICLGVRPFDRIYGRDHGIFIHGPDGTRVYGVPKIMNGVHHVHQSQIVQDALDSVRIVVVPSAGFGDAERAQIIANAREKFPHSIKVTVVVEQKLEKTRAGKTPFVIRRIPELP